MDGPVRFLRALAEAAEIVKRTAMDLGAQFLERLGIIVRAGKAEHLVPVGDQFLGCGAPDKSGRASDEYAHENDSLFRRAGYCYAIDPGKVVSLYRYKG